MEIASSTLRGVPLLWVAGDVDHLAGPALLATAERALDGDCSRILLDLAACPYLDSGGIGALLTILKQVKSRLGWVGVVSPTRDVHRLLEIVALTLDPNFRVFPNTAGAEAYLEAEALES